jgi:uncharacterized protein (TIRG00374 family)
MIADAFQKASIVPFKISVSLGFILWLLSTIDADQILLHWQDTEWRFLVLLAPVIFLAYVVISVLRWRLILKQQGISVSFWSLVVIHTKGAFLATLLPGGNASGDIYRMYSLAKETGTKTVSVSSVLMERVMGFFSLLIFSLGALYYAIFKTKDEVFTPLAKPVLFITVLFFTVSAISVALMKKGYLNKVNSNNFIILTLQNFGSTIPNYFSNKVIVGKVFLLSLLLQFTIVFWTYAVSRAMNISISFQVLSISIPLISFFTLLPISLGGLGVREAAHVFFLVPFGLQPSEAVSISLMSVMSQTILYLLSGSVFFLDFKTKLAENRRYL